MENQSTDRLELAAKFINNTGAPIFLTGKAGTGKTTFLRDLSRLTHKQFVIVAPTGIAALNARGVTIHSQFLLPFGSFLPTREAEGNFTDQFGFFTQQTLARKHPLNQLRRNVLKAIDLLVIDEVSMLRADILDAIDYRMRSVKRNYKVPFGGIQVLLIGDLYQLPPVVKDQEWAVLNRFYNSMHFFEAKALQNSGMVYLELDKIFRQSDDVFIRILNNLRDNRATPEDVRILNQHFKTLDEIRDLPPTITLTTHNYKADELNLRELRGLDSPSFFFEAEVDREFPETLFPLPKSIELKVGARVMFIKNDSSGNSSYFNGKLATVTKLEKEEVIVELDDSQVEFVLRKELWENKKYRINPDTKELEGEVIGTFTQYPIKLAWAVTVHKSQGLTFDRAIIDVGQAFAPGQVYVALSRLRTLDGLILRTRVQPEVIYSDPKVVDFTKGAGLQLDLSELLSQNQVNYLNRLIQETFEFESLIKSISQFDKDQDSSLEFEDENLRKDLPDIYQSLEAEGENTRKFRTQLLVLLQQNQEQKLLERVEKGTGYYLNFLQGILEKLMLHQAKVEDFSRIKTYQNGLEELELELLRKYLDIARSGRLIQAISKGEITGKMPDLEQQIAQKRKSILDKLRESLPEKAKASTKTGRKKSVEKKTKAPKEKKGSSSLLSVQMFLEGKSPQEIATEREYALTTIMGHLGAGVKSGTLKLEQLVSDEAIREIQPLAGKFDSLKPYFEHFGGKYDYGTLRLVLFSGEEKE
ncbi:helix-turn-helix domain-containing protein [Algoriphagus sp. A40]|uniref:helix-turn-helix domain-containing protein n=1 Tax=Algoriphagus sp. A40 TaxID=1945863 RepID=UPI000987566F|nr:helix-turn-helix domain-containing protein [Algoriphagus sp. A40]OOG73135.1 helicase [Algoriphagus sp. A40]